MFTYDVLTGQSKWEKTLRNITETKIFEYNKNLKIVGFPDLANLFGNIVRDNDGKCVLKPKRKAMEI